MESSIFAKLIFFLASILGLVTSPAYVELGAASLTFDYKTGDVSPIVYYLNVKNIGSQKAKFIASSNAQWLFIAREGTDFTKSVDIETQAAVNFVLTIQAREAADGSNSAEIIIEAVSADGYSTPYDSKKITVTVNKNVIPAPEVAATTPTVSTASPTLAPTVVATPVAVSPTVPVVATPKPKATSRPRLTVPLTPTSVPTVSPTSTPAITPRVPSPFPTTKPLPEEAAPQAQARRGVLDNIWSFFKGLFF